MPTHDAVHAEAALNCQSSGTENRALRRVAGNIGFGHETATVDPGLGRSHGGGFRIRGECGGLDGSFRWAKHEWMA